MTSHSWRDLIHTSVANDRAQCLKSWQGQPVRRGNVRVPMQVGSRFHFLGLFIERSCPFEDNEGLQSLLSLIIILQLVLSHLTERRWFSRDSNQVIMARLTISRPRLTCQNLPRAHPTSPGQASPLGPWLGPPKLKTLTCHYL